MAKERGKFVAHLKFDFLKRAHTLTEDGDWADTSR